MLCRCLSCSSELIRRYVAVWTAHLSRCDVMSRFELLIRADMKLCHCLDHSSEQNRRYVAVWSDHLSRRDCMSLLELLIWSDTMLCRCLNRSSEHTRRYVAVWAAHLSRHDVMSLFELLIWADTTLCRCLNCLPGQTWRKFRCKHCCKFALQLYRSSVVMYCLSSLSEQTRQCVTVWATHLSRHDVVLLCELLFRADVTAYMGRCSVLSRIELLIRADASQCHCLNCPSEQTRRYVTVRITHLSRHYIMSRIELLFWADTIRTRLHATNYTVHVDTHTTLCCNLYSLYEHTLQFVRFVPLIWADMTLVRD